MCLGLLSATSLSVLSFLCLRRPPVASVIVIVRPPHHLCGSPPSFTASVTVVSVGASSSEITSTSMSVSVCNQAINQILKAPHEHKTSHIPAQPHGQQTPRREASLFIRSFLPYFLLISQVGPPLAVSASAYPVLPLLHQVVWLMPSGFCLSSISALCVCHSRTLSYIPLAAPPPHIVPFYPLRYVFRIFEVYIVPSVEMIRRVDELGAASTVQAIYQAVSYPSFLFICNVCWLCPLSVLTVGSSSAGPMSSPIYTVRLSPLA